MHFVKRLLSLCIFIFGVISSINYGENAKFFIIPEIWKTRFLIQVETASVMPYIVLRCRRPDPVGQQYTIYGITDKKSFPFRLELNLNL